MEESNTKIDNFIDSFEKITKNPESFLIGQNGTDKAYDANNVRNFVKDIYDFVKCVERNPGKGTALPELLIQNFDEEQIWQEIELQNNDNFRKFSSSLSFFKNVKDTLSFPTRLEEESKVFDVNEKKSSEKEESAAEDEESDEEKEESVDGGSGSFGSDVGLESDSDVDNEDVEGMDSDGSDTQTKKNTKKDDRKKQQKPSIVDDAFFKLSEMEQFLLAEEKREEKGDDSGESDLEIDYFDDVPSDDGEDEESQNEKRYKYKDFFAAPSKSDGKQMPNKDNSDEERNLEEGEERERYKYKDFFAKPAKSERKRKHGNDYEGNVEDDVNSEEGEGNDYVDEEEEEEGGHLETDKGKSSKKKVSFAIANGENKEDENNDSDFDGGDDEDEEMKSDEDERGGVTVKSALEMREERLKLRILQLEAKAMSEKPWQMKGEISATARPQNSLLEEVLEFDSASRAAPVMTEVTTERLEDIIMRRIKDKAWDDVERKVKPVETVNEFKKRLVLDQEKSKQSLADIYEKEYIKQRDAAASVGLGAPEDKEPEEPPEHKKVTSLMVSLFAKLDALSNYHYTPQMAAPEVKIVNNLPAITMEEVAPVTSTDATLLAPEEVLGKKKSNLLGKEERTVTDKKRERRKKKKFQHAKKQQEEKREELGGNKIGKYNKDKAAKDLKELSKSRNVKVDMGNKGSNIKTSTAFFNKLQDDIKSQANVKLKTKKKDNHLNAKKLKL